MNAVVEKSNPNASAPRIDNVFGPLAAVSPPNGASANALMAREAQDIMVQMMAARNNPRDIVKSVDRILNAFTRPALCEDATYEYARGGTDISGLSIRAAEVLAQNWGNMRSGVVELARQNGQSEVLVYAQDLETGYEDAKRFFVKHWRDTKQGGYQVTDERDIYELVANQGARRKRACILTVIPKDVQDAALDQIDVTMRTKAEVTDDSIKTLLDSFVKYGVTQEMIEKRIQRRIQAMLPAQLVQLRRIGVSLRDNMSAVEQWFEVPATAAATAGGNGGAQPSTKTGALKDELKAKTGQNKAPATTDAPIDQAKQISADKDALAAAKTETDLDKVWKPMRERWLVAIDEIPMELEGCHHDRLEYFRGLAGK